MSRYWVSWYEPVIAWDPVNGPNNDPVYGAPQWPDAVTVVQTWETGWRLSDDAKTICALIDSTSLLAIEQALEGRTVRFLEPKPDDWSPASDRFPLEDPASLAAVETPPII